MHIGVWTCKKGEGLMEKMMTNGKAFKWAEIILGVLFIGLGIYTLCNPLSAALSVTVIYALGALVTGLVDIFTFFHPKARTAKENRILTLVAGILLVFSGIVLLCNPFSSTVMLTGIFFPIWFTVHCMNRITSLSMFKDQMSTISYWTSLILNIFALVMGFSMMGNLLFSLNTMATLIAFFFLLEGIGSFLLAFSRANVEVDVKAD